MKEQAIERINKQIQYLKANRENLVADADTHITDLGAMDIFMKRDYCANPNYYQGRPISLSDMLTEMKMANVDICLSWQNPASTPYPGDYDRNYASLLHSNKYIYDCANEYPEHIIPTGWVDPKGIGMENAKEMIRVCTEEHGCPIIKLNPAQNAYMIDSDIVMELTADIINAGAVPAYHFAADTPYTTISGLTKIAETFPDSPILVIHFGGGGCSYIEGENMYTELRQLGLKYKNLYLIESAKRDTHIESDIITYALSGEEDFKRVFAASDAPYGRMTWNYGGYRNMFASLIDSENHTDARVRENPEVFTPKLQQMLLGTNFVDFIIASYERLLEHYYIGEICLQTI